MSESEFLMPLLINFLFLFFHFLSVMSPLKNETQPPMAPPLLATTTTKQSAKQNVMLIGVFDGPKITINFLEPNTIILHYYIQNGYLYFTPSLPTPSWKSADQVLVRLPPHTVGWLRLWYFRSTQIIKWVSITLFVL